MITKKELGEMLRERRKEMERSVRWVAKKAGLSRRTLDFIESGSNAANFDTLNKILEALDMHIEIVKNETTK